MPILDCGNTYKYGIIYFFLNIKGIKEMQVVGTFFKNIKGIKEMHDVGTFFLNIKGIKGMQDVGASLTLRALRKCKM